MSLDLLGGTMQALVITLLLLTNPKPAHLVDAPHLAINGVQVGMRRSEVLVKVGKPLRTVKGYDEVMGSGHWEKLHYSGLMVEVIQPIHGMLKRQDQEPYVSRIVLSGPSWVIANGLRLGMSPKQTEAILGKPESTEAKRRQLRRWYYTARFDGRVTLRFQNESLVELIIEEDWT